MSKSELKLVEVYRAAGEAEAELIRGMLESSGIPCILRSHAAPSVHVFTLDGLGEVKVMVPNELVEEARRLIARDDDV